MYDETRASLSENNLIVYVIIIVEQWLGYVFFQDFY